VPFILWAYGHKSPLRKSTPNAGLLLLLVVVVVVVVVFLLQPRVAWQH